MSDKDEIIEFLKLKLKNESVLGNHNSTTELRFKNFVSENFIGEDFNNLQLQGIYNLLKETLTSNLKMIKTGGIIFSRMSSTRLPGKAMIPINGVSLLERVINRSKLISEN